MITRHTGILPILLFWMLSSILLSCDSLQTGRQLYESGLDNFKAADHGDYHNDEGLAEAIKDFEKSIEKGFNERDVFEMLAQSYHFLNQDLENEERVYSLGLEAHPGDFEFHYYRGECRKELKNQKGAFEDFDDVIALDTARNGEYVSDAFYERGAMRYILGDTINANKDREVAQSLADYELRTYSDYCRLWK